MKVYNKKGTYQSLGLYIIVLIFCLVLLFLTISTGSIKKPEVLLVPCVFWSFMIAIIIRGLVAKPIKRKCMLIEKTVEEENGTLKTNMKFAKLTEEIRKYKYLPTVYECYTIGENNLELNNIYYISIRPSNHEILEVDEKTTNEVTK